MSSIKALAKQTFIYGLSSIVGRFLNYLLVPLYVYTFQPHEYGIVTEYYAYAVILQIILTYGIETGFFRFVKNSDNHFEVFSTAFISLFMSSSVFLIFTLMFSKKISFLLDYNTSLYTILFAFILFFDTITTIFFANLRAQNKPLKFASLKLINIFTNILLNLFFILLCPYLIKKGLNLNLIYNPHIGVAYIFISNLIASLLSFIIFIPYLFKHTLIFNLKLYKNLLTYSLPLLFTGLIGAFIETADRIFIKRFTFIPENIVDSNNYILHQLGVYGAVTKIAVIIILFIQAFRFAAEPFLFSISNDNEKRNGVFKDIVKYFLIFSFTVFLFIMLNISIFKYFVSPKYYEGLSILFPYMLSRILYGLFFILSFWYKLFDKNKKSIYIYIIGAIFLIILDIIFIPLFGYLAAAWAIFLTYFLMTIISYILSRKYLMTNYNWKYLSLFIFIPILIYLFSTFINIKNSIISLFIKNFIFLLYIFIVLKLEPKMLNSIIQFIKNFFYEHKYKK